MTTAAIQIEQTKVHIRAIIFDIDDSEDGCGAAMVRDIYEVDNVENGRKCLRSIVTANCPDVMHVRVPKATIGTVQIGNSNCIPARTRTMLWKKAWANSQVDVPTEAEEFVEPEITNEQLLANALFDVLDSLGALGNFYELCDRGFTEERAKEIVRLVHKG